jgi:hypothetical protein
MPTVDERLDAIEGLLPQLVARLGVSSRHPESAASKDAAPVLMTGAELRAKLRWGKDRFFAAVKSGRFVSLISVNASSARRPVYLRAKVDAWLSETPTLTLRAYRRLPARKKARE